MEILPIEPREAHLMLGKLTTDEIDRMALLVQAAIGDDVAAEILADVHHSTPDEARAAAARALSHIQVFRGHSVPV